MKRKYDQLTDIEKSTRLKNHYIIHIAFYAFMFNLLPIVFISANMSDFILYMLLLGFPALIYVAGIIFALYNRFKWIYILFPTVLFIPAAFIYYNYTALVYMVLYAASAALGMLVGNILIWIFTKKPAVSAGSSKIKADKKK
ncbi:MAG TPA: hypothetical protein PLT91_00425 [Clostridia bacterium]|jgi:hypothetical protein|nr:MAG: hypothetical protein BWX97_00212 [Firmicutes bacterium ADurb.Bin146]HOD92317.1 hypothetical protein [Clostridia bacterium]HQM38686.1 hypothetical protein [Clostridia bacterium]